MKYEEKAFLAPWRVFPQTPHAYVGQLDKDTCLPSLF
jgi:hypothetical protein